MVVCGYAEVLPGDVPQGDVDAAEHTHERQVRVLAEPAGVYDPPHRLDPERVPAHDVTLHDVLDESGHLVGVKRHAVDLAEALDVVVRGQLEEDEIGPPLWGGGLATTYVLTSAILKLGIPPRQHFAANTAVGADPRVCPLRA